MLSKNYIHTKTIRRLLSQQYRRKNINEVKAEVEQYLPDGYILKVNENTGFLFISVK
jgi:hypothetical protein